MYIYSYRTTLLHHPTPPYTTYTLPIRSHLTQGCTFGEAAAVSGQRADYFAFAATHCDLYTLDAELFLHELADEYSHATVRESVC
jgi:CRP-like cAMP-binding protein